MRTAQTLTGGRRFGYAFGIGCESILYNAFYVYYLIFLTNVAGIDPALAGTVALIAVMVEAVMDPLIGWICDRPGFDARRLMLPGGILAGVLFCASFAIVGGGQGVRFLYYAVCSSLMWCAYAVFTIPYYAVCAQMTDDYDEQNRIRGLSGTINSFMIYGGCVLPILVVTALTGAGFDPRWSWTAGAGVIGALSMAIGIIAYISIKDVAFIRRDVAPEKTDFLQAAKEILRLKPMRCFLPCVFFFLFGSAMCSANQDYLLIYAVGVSPDAIKYSALFTMLAFLLLTPVFTAIATKWDRKPALLLAFAVSVLGSLACRVHGIDSMGIMYVLTVCQAVGLVGFWTLFYPFAYDIVELDEYRNRKSRAGTITAFPHFCQEFGNACGLQAIGIILKLIGYDPAGSAQTAAGAQYAAQSAATVSGIQNISTVFLAVCICISAVCILLYPLNKKRYAKVQAANERRRAGETDFSDPEVDAIL